MELWYEDNTRIDFQSNEPIFEFLFLKNSQDIATAKFDYRRT